MSTFISRLREQRVTLSSSSILPVLGLLFWLVAASLYAACVEDAGVDTTVGRAYLAILGCHAVVGGAVAVDAGRYGGTAWPLQWLVIGTGTSITLMLTALVGHSLAEDVPSLPLAVGALLTACYANAMLLAILFEYFHRAIPKPATLPAKKISVALAPRPSQIRR